MKIAVTGHRPSKLNNEYDMNGPCSEWIRLRLRNLIKSKRAVNQMLQNLSPDGTPLDEITLISGMALGADMIFAELSIELNLPLIAAIPFVGQERVWKQHQKDRYYQILESPLVVKHIVCEGGYAPWKMLKRNEWICDQLSRTDTLAAVWDGSDEGGTAHCVKYAQSKNVDIERINPFGYVQNRGI